MNIEQLPIKCPICGSMNFEFLGLSKASGEHIDKRKCKNCSTYVEKITRYYQDTSGEKKKYIVGLYKGE